MKKGAKIAGFAVLLLLIAAFMGITGHYCFSRNRAVVCDSLVVRIAPRDTLAFLTRDSVVRWLREPGLYPVGTPLSAVNTDAMERLLRSQTYVRRARVYTTGGGAVNVELEQRRPVARFRLGDALDAYADGDGNVLPPVRDFVADVPVVTLSPDRIASPGHAFGADREKDFFLLKNYKLFDNLLNFVKFVNLDVLWNAQIVQVNVTQEDEIELVPRIGSHVVLLGGLDGYRAKLGKLAAFYRSELRTPGFAAYRYVNLKYKDQVVCTK